MRRQSAATSSFYCKVALAAFSVVSCAPGALATGEAKPKEMSPPSAQESSSKRQNKFAPKSSPCGVWFAESTIPGAGFGMYAGVDYDADDEVTPGDLVVPYMDMPWHNGVVEDEEMGFLWNE